MTKQIFEAIHSCDKSFDGKLWYGVTSTRIFCRPSCKSRTPKYENIVLFDIKDNPVNEGFRPCKRCKPFGMFVPNELWTNTIKDYISKFFKQKLSLKDIAEACHGSVYHLLRVFRDYFGMTPFEYQSELRLNEAKRLLTQSNLSIKDIALTIGIKNSAQFIALFKKKHGITPLQYRKDIKHEV